MPRKKIVSKIPVLLLDLLSPIFLKVPKKRNPHKLKPRDFIEKVIAVVVIIIK